MERTERSWNEMEGCGVERNEWMNGEQCGVLMRMRERMNWNGVLRDETRNGNEVVNALARSTCQ